jgi:hypothetical protein
LLKAEGLWSEEGGGFGGPGGRTGSDWQNREAKSGHNEAMAQVHREASVHREEIRDKEFVRAELKKEEPGTQQTQNEAKRII